MDDLLLQYLHELRDGQRDILAAVVEQGKDITQLKTQTEPLFDNGQPGLLTAMKKDIRELQGLKKYALGFIAGFVALEGTFHYLLHKLGLK